VSRLREAVQQRQAIVQIAEEYAGAEKAIVDVLTTLDVSLAAAKEGAGRELSPEEENAARRAAEGALASTASEPLTEREMTILDFLAQGQSNAEIAEKLAVSEEVVQLHIERFLGKLPVTSMSQRRGEPPEAG
jgi:DNA-binding NarL/FixJ family response regulator